MACTASGVSAIWLPGGPTLPTALPTLLNTALLFIVAIVTVIFVRKPIGV